MSNSLPCRRKPSRKIKPHTKSRRGCVNCKLRKVKCGEEKPTCNRCTSFGMLCSYDNNNPDSHLQLLVDKALIFESLHQRHPYSLSQTIPTIPGRNNIKSGWNGDHSHNFAEQQHLEILDRFQSRSVYTITTNENRGIYQSEFIKLACTNPHLMHALLTFTLMHDRHIAATRNIKISSTEAFHWQQSIALFNTKLSSGPLQPFESDALWASSVLLCTVAFCHIEAETPEQAWPLAQPSLMDLNWLLLSFGKAEVGRILDKDQSSFRELMRTSLMPFSSADPNASLSTLPHDFITIYSLDAISSAETNPYHLPAYLLADVLHSNEIITIILKFWAFVDTLNENYKNLLRRKEPKAILLLSYWLAKLCQFPHWWIWRRVSLECHAICIYLERYYPDAFDYNVLLRYPKFMLGL